MKYDTLSALSLPPLIITTFLENAYEHAIKGCKGERYISVVVDKQKDNYVISIVNTGRSMSKDKFFEITENSKPENLSKHRLEFSPSDTILHGGRSGRGRVNALARIYLFNKLNRNVSINISYDQQAFEQGYTKVLLELKLNRKK